MKLEAVARFHLRDNRNIYAMAVLADSHDQERTRAFDVYCDIAQEDLIASLHRFSKSEFLALFGAIPDMPRYVQKNLT